MRLQLSLLLARAVALWGVLLCAVIPARAEHLPQNVSGEAVFRGNYWRDRNTRVINPTVDIRQQTASGFAVTGSYGLDAITSASVAAGATSDEPFTELRHEVGFGTEIPLVGKSTLSAGYGYSSESDYFSHTGSLRTKISLFQENTILRFGGDYTHSSVGKRLGPTGYLNMGILHEGHAIAGWTQVPIASYAASLGCTRSIVPKASMKFQYRGARTSLAGVVSSTGEQSTTAPWRLPGVAIHALIV